MKAFFFAGFWAVAWAGVEAGLSVKETEGSIEILDGDLAVVTYHKAKVPVPEGVDAVFARSAFLHPLRTPSGRVVTSVFPADHHHHMGVWHAWTKAQWDGHRIDFWNLKKGEGFVRYKETRGTFEGGQSVGFSVVQEHVAVLDGKEVVVLVDLLTVEGHREGDAYLLRYHTAQENVTDKPLVLPAHRYGGGLAYRGPEDWGSKNSSCLTSAGNGREDGHATRAEWVAYSGEVDGGKATVVLVGDEGNRDAPQRVRIWPESANGGAPFFNFVPVQEHAWEVAAYDVVELGYRLILADGELGAEEVGKLLGK